MPFAVVMVSRQVEGVAGADMFLISVSRLQKSHGYAPPKIVVNSQQSAVARHYLLKSLLEYRVNDIAEIIFVVGGESFVCGRKWRKKNVNRVENPTVRGFSFFLDPFHFQIEAYRR